MGSDENAKIVTGVVTGHLAGVCSMIQYQDGCARPGNKSLEKDSTVTSEAQIISGVCEHFVLEVRAPAKPQTIRTVAPQPVPQAKPLTVQNILATVEQRKAQP